MAESVGKAFIMRPGEGKAIDLGGFSVSVKANADDTDGAFSLLEADEPPGLALRCTFTTTQRRRFMCWQVSTSFTSRSARWCAQPGRSYTSQQVCATGSGLVRSLVEN